MRPTDDTPTADFTPDERQALLALRRRLQRPDYRFNAQERAQLLFLRWLLRTGRIVSGEPAGPSVPPGEEVAA